MKSRTPRHAATLFNAALAAEQKTPAHFSQNMEMLVKAIDAGSQTASAHLLTEIFNKEILNTTDAADPDILSVISQLEKIATNNRFAAYVLGRVYAGVKTSGTTISPQLNVTDLSVREARAIQYLEIAAKLKHEDARVFLGDAFATGHAGCVQVSASRWIDLTKVLADANGQASALDYALFRSGTLADGRLISEAKHIHIAVPQDHVEAMQYFLDATKGSNLTIASQALQGINRLLAHSTGPWHDKRNEVLELLDAQAKLGNEVIALCMAYYYCPQASRPALPASLASLMVLQSLVPAEQQSMNKAAQYLAVALSSLNVRVKTLATLFLENIPSQAVASSAGLRS